MVCYLDGTFLLSSLYFQTQAAVVAILNNSQISHFG